MNNNSSEMNQERMGMMCPCGNYTCIVHVIRPGDTLYRLSREYGLKVSALMMANPFVDIYNLRIGDELCIPRLRRTEENVSMSMPRRMPDTNMRPMVTERNEMPSQWEVNRMPGRTDNMDMRDDDRVVDAEMNMNPRKTESVDMECPKCNGISYQQNDDTY